MADCKRVEIIVADSGVGISPEDLERLGRPYEQAGGNDQRAMGTGLGLSLVRDSIAIREAQARGLVVADRVSLDCMLNFVCLQARRTEPVVASAWAALEQVWR